MNPRFQPQTAMDRSCSLCGAKPGEKCRTKSGKTIGMPHADREWLPLEPARPIPTAEEAAEVLAAIREKEQKQKQADCPHHGPPEVIYVCGDCGVHLAESGPAVLDDGEEAE